jgi:hypothetical protein
MESEAKRPDTSTHAQHVTVGELQITFPPPSDTVKELSPCRPLPLRPG